MNSFHMLRKILFYDSSLRLSRLYININNCRTQNLSSTAWFKVDPNNRNENRTDSKSGSNLNENYVESDTFGTLKSSLENGFRFNRKSPNRSIKQENKKIIKLKKPKNDESDVFGNLSEKSAMWYPDINEESKEDNDLSDDSVIVKNISKRFRCPKKYLEEMKKLVLQKRVKEALDLFVDMRKNFVTPIHAHYTYMIGACGRIGYTEMAFRLLRQMTDRSFQPTPATLTGLFNSCAESPFPEYGLKKARLLKEKIEMRNWQMTQITYHAMIKAFGKCGDLVTAFKIVDEMAKADIKIDVTTYSFLLMSCITNKEAGFTYAVEVLRMMKAKKCKPNTFTFNLMLRATRDCDVGPEDISCLLLQHWSSYSKRPYGFMTKESLAKQPILKLSSGLNSSTTESLETENKNDAEAQAKIIRESSDEGNARKYEVKSVFNTSITNANLPTSVASVLSARPIHGPEILEIVNIKTAGDRLSLIGGLEGFLDFMLKSRAKLNIKTFTLLLECLPDNIEEEEKMLSILDNCQMKPDIDFFNVLIKRRNFRLETEAARNVLVLINKYSLTPDIMTFGALALGCRNLKQASLFISEMEKMGSYPNIEIVGCMAKRAYMILDFPYMKYVLELMEEQQIKPNEKTLLTIEKYLADARKNIILMEHGKEVNAFYQKKGLQEDFKDFLNFYEKWLKRMKFQPEEHPWSQYKTDIIVRDKEEYIS